MARFDAEYSPPKKDTAEIPDGARAAFEKQGAELFSSLGLRDGGFRENADRVFMLDDQGKLVTPPPYDSEKENDMTAAARDGRLFVMDKDYRLRQVRLEEKKDDGFAFAVTNPLKRQQMPTSRLDCFMKRASVGFDDFTRNVMKAWTGADRRREEHNDPVLRFFDRVQKRMDNFFNRMQARLDKAIEENERRRANMDRSFFSPAGLFEGLDKLYEASQRFFKRIDKALGLDNDRTKQPEIKAEGSGPLIPEEKPLENQQPKEEQIQQSQPEESKEKTLEDLLATNPTKQTTPEFEKYLTALSDRGNKKPVEQALEKQDGKPKDYYEAVAQELEGNVAGKILDAAPKKEADPAGREKFLHDQKPVMASISKNLRAFVQQKVAPEVVEGYYEARASKDDSVKADLDAKKVTLQEIATRLVTGGANEYTVGVQKQNEENKQVMQQSQPKQLQQNQLQAQQRQAPTLETPKAPTIGGR